MTSWVPGFKLVEGPEETGIRFRFRGFRERDSAPAWIRVDGYGANDREAALAVAAVYEATASLDHPDLPRVLGYGSTSVAGRPFIAFLQEDSLPSQRPGETGLDEATALLADIQILAYECGYAGVHVPVAELARIRAGKRLEGRRLPIRESLCEPRRGDGRPPLSLVEAEDVWAPLTAPEVLTGPRHRRYSIREAITYRLAAQAYYLAEGRVPSLARAGVEDTGTEIGETTIHGGERPEVRSLGRSKVVKNGLDPRPSRRPPIEQFVFLENESAHRGG